MSVIFKLGGVPSDKKYRDMTPSQWAVLVKHFYNDREFVVETAMSIVEYLAMLISPSPKDTIKAIEERRKKLEREKFRQGRIDKLSDEHQLFKKDHRNTTFYESLKEFGGEAAAQTAAKMFDEDLDQISSTEDFQPDSQDLEFIQKAMDEAEALKVKDKEKESLDSVEF